MGPNSAADTVYVITIMSPPAFTSEDPGFFGSLVAMPMAEFRAKVRTTRADPRLLKGMVLTPNT